MPGKLFIGNLSFNIADSELSELFASQNIPVASISVMRDMETGRPRGFAFAELAPEADMEAAIKQLNGKVLGGRALTVNEARPQKPREGGRSGGFGRGGGRSSGHRGGREGGGYSKRGRGPALY